MGLKIYLETVIILRTYPEAVLKNYPETVIMLRIYLEAVQRGYYQNLPGGRSAATEIHPERCNLDILVLLSVKNQRREATLRYTPLNRAILLGEM